MATIRLRDHPLVRRVRGLASTDRAGDGVLVALAAGVGLATGLLAVALIELVRAVQAVAFAGPDRLVVVLAPTLGGLLVGVLITYWVPEARGAGVSQVMTAIALHGGRMRPVLALGKLLTSGLALGTGASGGREGPIVQIGGAVGSTAGRLLNLNEEQKRAVIAAGAGAGIAASFNAPIGGMLFALEVIIGGFRARYLQVIVVACVVASVTARTIVGPELIYSPPPFTLADPRELLLYAVLGLTASGVGVALVRGEAIVTVVAERARVWPPLRTAAGGLGVGLIALAVPEVLGTGDHLPPVLGVVTDPIAGMLAGEVGGTGLSAAGVLLVLLVAKLAATALTLGTGSSAGSFAPAVFIGAALGGAYGHVTAAVLPGAAVAPGAFALAGMAAVVGASTRAPLTAILLAFELTGDYGLVLPLMLATGIATFLADRLDRESAYTLPLTRRGIVYAEPEDVDIMQTVRVGEIMNPDPPAVPPSMTVPELQAEFRRTRRHGFPVVDGDRLVGVVTISDLARAVNPDGVDEDAMTRTGDIMALRERTVGDICTRRVLTVTPEDPVFRAVRRMGAIDAGRLPVVAAEDHSRLVGMVGRADVVKAYQRAVTRSLGVQQRQQSSRLRDLAGTQFVELVVAPDAEATGRAVRDVVWPPRTILTNVRRNGEAIMPNGDTVLEAGDEVVVLTDQQVAGEVRRLIAGVAPDE
ncbi:MAG TPA: chloride channel protein [Egibacteraceae bacterium]|nr:chloride channel protein [Egibacteraceae bacterium]